MRNVAALLLASAIFAAGQPAVTRVLVTSVILPRWTNIRVSSLRMGGKSPTRPAWEYLDRAVVAATQHLERRLSFNAEHVFSHTIKGFAAPLSPEQIRKLQADNLVETIELDAPMQAISQTLPWGVDRVEADLSSTRAGDGTGTVAVNAYVIDSGIDPNHADPSVVRFLNFIDTNMSDCNGHGTHVAGSRAARDNATGVIGIAPGASLTALKVLDCNGSGSRSGVIKAVDWITANAVRPAVANMSLGGPASSTLDSAVKKSADRGIFYAVAAGNSGASACN